MYITEREPSFNIWTLSKSIFGGHVMLTRPRRENLRPRRGFIDRLKLIAPSGHGESD